MFRRSLTALAASILLLLAATSPAPAIVGGTPDQAHPYVGALFRIDPEGQTYYLCTGSLLSSREFLTAGHCVQAILPGDHAFVSFAPKLDGPLDPFTGAAGPQSAAIPADAWMAHPAYRAPGANIALNDVGLVHLAKAVRLDGIALPQTDAAGTLTRGDLLVDVGYGLDSQTPPTWTGTRQWTYAGFNGLTQDFLDTVQLKNGGTPCAGDSGAPVFMDDRSNVVLALVSWGSMGGCGLGAGHNQRIDTPQIRDWLLHHTYPAS